ncbi:MAG: PepSY-associated TM helix domain-containing protein, partial [Candidatus Halalkalibacterium sp. M3_1C_030]
LSITGSILVFEHEIDRFLNRDLLTVSDPANQDLQQTAIAIDESIANIQKSYSEKEILFLNLPSGGGQTIEAWLGSDPNYTFVYTNPHTGEIIGSRTARGSFTTIVHELHAHLLTGDTGSIIVGISGIVLVLLCFTGIILWFPKVGKFIKSISVSFRKKFKRVNYDLHRSVGFWTCLLLLLFAITGSALVFYTGSESLLRQMLNEEVEKTEPPKSVPGAITVTDIYRAALEKAKRSFPKATVSYLYLPQNKTDVITVRMRQPAEWHPNGRTFVYLDQYSLEQKGLEDGLNTKTSTSIMNMMYPLHIGSFGGYFIKWLYFIIGLAPALLTITGVIIWWLKKKKKSPDK